MTSTEVSLELEIMKAEKETGVDSADATSSVQYKQLEMQNNRMKEVLLPVTIILDFMHY
jgi:hypothetical protein